MFSSNAFALKFTTWINLLYTFHHSFRKNILSGYCLKKMIYDLKRRCFQGIFCLFFIIIQLTTGFSVDDRDDVHTNGRAQWMESCLEKNCGENLTCNQYFTCQCRPGYRTFNNTCLRLAEENEECEKQDDCIKPLLCIHGLCRKPFPSSDFVFLANVCLGITATVLIVAMCSTLIKCLIRYDGSRVLERQGRTSSSLRTLRNPFQRSESQLRQIVDEKPPSYEECLRVTTGNTEPPPYVITTNAVDSVKTVTNSQISQTGNLPVVSQSSSTPLNVRIFLRGTGPNLNTFTQNPERVHNVPAKQLPPS